MADEQLAVLGQQFLDAVIEQYNPHGDPSLALAIHPGQALADDVVQNGVTNELRLSQWLEDQYDYPLWLKLSDGTSVPASSIGGLTAKSAYLAMIPWATPGIDSESPAYARISALIADARKDLGDNPDALPFGCEPTDFAQTDSTGWHVFDTKVSNTSTSTTTGTPVKVRVNPELWQMRPVTAEMMAHVEPTVTLAAHQKELRESLKVLPRQEAVTRLREIPDVQEALVQPVATDDQANLLVSPSRLAALRTENFAKFSNLSQNTTISALRTRIPINEDPWPGTKDTITDQDLSNIQIGDVTSTPPVTETTVSGTELHVHFEWCLLTITRRLSGVRWWHPELIAARSWYVPGMKLGDMVRTSAEPAYAQCLPQGLLLVRNVEFTGTWTQEALDTMKGPVSFLGPFLLRDPVVTTSTSNVTQVSVLGVGVQVIGELCSPLPALPPMDDPN